MIKFIISVATIYAIICLLVYVMQRSFLYFPTRHLVKPDLFQEVELNTVDGLKLVSWYVPAKDKQPTLIYFHGNGGNIAMREYHTRPYLNRGIGVLLLEYRGYGGNPGKPNEIGLYHDAEAAYEFVKQQGVPPECIIVFGESLGSGVAVEMARRHPVGGVVLQAPFTSAFSVGQGHYPFLPVGLLLKDRFNSISKIKQFNVPLAVVHGTADRVVPFKHGKKLFAAANEPKQFFEFPGFDHNNLDAQAVSDKVLGFFQQQQHFSELNACQINPN